MKTLTTSALALALVACGNNKQSSPTAGSDPAAPIVSGKPTEQPAPAPAATPTPAPPAAATFASIVNRATPTTQQQVDASSLGTSVEAYLVTRFGGPGSEDPSQDQQFDFGLVLVGNGKAIRVELGRYDSIVERPKPFGTLEVTEPFGGRTFVPDRDAFEGAPRLGTKAPVILADTVSEMQDVMAFVVTQSADKLEIWYAAALWEDEADKDWDLDTTIELAKGATVTAGRPVIDAAPLTSPIEVRLFDDQIDELEGRRYYAVRLQLGDRVGMLAETSASPSMDTAWVIGASTDGLPPPPKADELLAHRTYFVSSQEAEFLLLGRTGDELLLWSLLVLDGFDDEQWGDPIRIPLPAGAKLELK